MITSIFLALYLLGYVSAITTSNFLLISGIMLIIGEIAFSTFWIIGFNGLLALYVGYALRTGDQTLFGLHIDWDVFFGMAFVEFILLASVITIIIRHRRGKVTTGTESMIGHKAMIVHWNGGSGQVSVQGELWKAKSDQPLELKAGDDVTVESVNGLVVTIKA